MRLEITNMYDKLVVLLLGVRIQDMSFFIENFHDNLINEEYYQDSSLRMWKDILLWTHDDVVVKKPVSVYSYKISISTPLNFEEFEILWNRYMRLRSFL